MVLREKKNHDVTDEAGQLVQILPIDNSTGYRKIDRRDNVFDFWKSEFESMAEYYPIMQKVSDLFGLTDDQHVEYHSKSRDPPEDPLHMRLVGTVDASALRKIGLDTDLDGIMMGLKLSPPSSLSLKFFHPDSEVEWSILLKENRLIGSYPIGTVCRYAYGSKPEVYDKLSKVSKDVMDYLRRS